MNMNSARGEMNKCNPYLRLWRGWMEGGRIKAFPCQASERGKQLKMKLAKGML